MAIITSAYDIISIALLPAMILPFGIAIATKSPIFLAIGIAAPLVDQSTKLIKHWTRNTPFGPRPKNAYNCSILNSGGDYSNKPGFPSGHAAVSTFISITLAYFLRPLIVNPTIQTIIIALAGIYIIATAVARVKKHCHTITQVIAGIIYGFAAATLFITVIKKYFPTIAFKA